MPSSPSVAAVAAYLDHPGALPERAVLAALDQPIAAADALAVTDLDRLLDPAPQRAENGWCWTPRRVGYVAVTTALPGHRAEMWDWWFDWHPREDLRYRIWHPQAHFANRLEPPARPGAKPFWWATHYPDEDVGLGRERVRIEFKPPSAYGFSHDGLDDARVGTIVGGHIGSRGRHMRVGVMTHVFLEHEDGLLLRSRFWLGEGLRPDLPGALGDGLGRVLDRAAIRRRALPAELPRALAVHCAEEYARLAALLPSLYAEHGARSSGARA